MFNANVAKGLAILALLFTLLPLLAQQAEVGETPVQALVRLSSSTVIPTVTVNRVTYAVGTDNGRPFQVRLEGGASQTFGVAQGRLAYRVDEDLYILDLQKGERKRVLPGYRVANAAWNAAGTRMAAVVTGSEGLDLIISDLDDGPVTLVASGSLLPDFLRWTSASELAYAAADAPGETKLVVLGEDGTARSTALDRGSVPFLAGLTDVELASDQVTLTLESSFDKDDAYPVAATESAIWTRSARDGSLEFRARNNSTRSKVESAASTFNSVSTEQAATAPASYGNYLGEYDSVAIYSNGNASYVSNESNYIGSTYIGMRWQCVELVRRYYFTKFGLDLASKFTGDARDWWGGATAMNLDRFGNGGSTPPEPGDIIVSQGDGKNVGHIGIVRSRNANSVCTANQNLSNTAEQVNRCLTLSTSGGSYTVGGFGTSYPITGWLRRKTTTSTAKAEITSPAPGSTLTGAVQTFTWTSGQGVSQYFLYAGTSVGANNIFGASTGTTRSATVGNLPTNGSTVYVRLWSLIGSSWQWADYQYRSATLVTQATAKAEITSPAPGSTLTGAVQTFTWTSGQGVSQYFLYAGTSVGANNIFGASTGTTRSATVGNLPTNGSMVYLRLWSLIGSSWQWADYQYRSATLVTQATAKAEITSPAPGSTLTGAVQTFTWTSGQGVSQYFLYAGTSVGANNIFGASTGTTRSATVGNLPTNGSTVYVRLWSFIGSSWQWADYQYRAAVR